MKKGKKNPQKKLERELWYSRHKAKHGQHELSYCSRWFKKII